MSVKTSKASFDKTSKASFDKTQRSGVSEKAHAGASRRYAETKIKYTDEPLGKVQVVADFLPSPDELAFREEGVKVTLALSKKSIDFFKSEASKRHTHYQRMIRRLLDAYVDAQAPTRQSTRTLRDKAARRR